MNIHIERERDGNVSALNSSRKIVDPLILPFALLCLLEFHLSVNYTDGYYTKGYATNVLTKLTKHYFSK